MTAPANNDAALVREAVETIRAWLPPMGATSIPDEPIKPAQANALHEAVRVLAATAERADEAEQALREYELEPAFCGECGTLMQAVRPGKSQCLGCERAETAEAALLVAQQERDEARKHQSTLGANLLTEEARRQLAERERDEALSQLVDVKAQQAADVAGWRKAEATNTRLREALQDIHRNAHSYSQWWAQERARAALGQDTEQETG